VRPKDHAYDALESLDDKTGSCLLMHGESLMLLLDTNKPKSKFFTVLVPGNRD